MATWEEIWSKRGLAELGADHLGDPRAAALRLNGYDGPTAGAVSPADFADYARIWAEQVHDADSASVYEVGCGSGAFLEAIGVATGWRELAGCDRSAALVEVGRSLFPHLGLEAADALSFPTRPPVDHAVSFGVFFYFPSLDYAAAAVRRMQEKAVRSVSILDVPDAALAAEAEADRRATWGADDYARRYAGLDHLYFERSWFSEHFPEDRWDVEISAQRLANYGNARFRFNVVARSAS